MKRATVVLAMVVAALLLCGQAQAIENGSWTTTGGQELFVDQRGQAMTVIWLAYDLLGDPFWLRAEGAVISGFLFEAPIYKLNGTPFGFKQTEPSIDQEWGNIRITFAGDGQATLQYDLHVYYLDLEFWLPVRGQTELRRR